jgi:hypothetical protein
MSALFMASLPLFSPRTLVPVGLEKVTLQLATKVRYDLNPDPFALRRGISVFAYAEWNKNRHQKNHIEK